MNYLNKPIHFYSKQSDQCNNMLSKTEFPQRIISLNETVEGLRLILDSTIEAICVIDLDGNFTFCNARCLQMLGYDRQEDLLGKNIHNQIHYKHLDGIPFPLEECPFYKTFLNAECSHMEIDVFWKADGTSFFAECFSYPLYQSGFPWGAVVTFMDVTHQELAQQELLESERSKSVFLANLPGMAYRCKFDQDYTMLFVSDGCFDLTGYKPQAILGNKEISYSKLISPEYREMVWIKWKHAIEAKTMFHLEYSIVPASDNVKWVLEKGQGIYNSSGDVVAIEGLIIDITDRKKKEDEILYLYYHDILTGLYNRNYFEKGKKIIDTKASSLPVSIIIADINGLKLINNAFGHDEGNNLLKKIAEVFKKCCRKTDIMARTGGDEFTILLPQTNPDEVHNIYKSITNMCEQFHINNVQAMLKLSMSMGYATKINTNQSIDEIIKIAEVFMYKRKLLQSNSLHSTLITSIKATLFAKSQETEEHAERLAALSKELGLHFHLTDEQHSELELLATLHDIGKIGIDDSILNKAGTLSEEEWAKMKEHPEIGYRITMSSPDLSSISMYILCHHEYWNGQGYPQGLKGKEIPLLSRIIAVTDAYDAMTQERPYRKAMSKEAALVEINNNAGTQFDQDIAYQFIQIMLNMDNNNTIYPENQASDSV